MRSYNPKTLEFKWSRIWDKQKSFRVDIKNAKKPFYNLAMFPYPSGEGLHVGHIIPYSGVDTYGRYLRMKGFDVFEPMGFDAFGIHSENFAIKKGIHPKTLIAQTTKYFRQKQMKRLGTLFDWDREVNTTDPNYYKWTQWLFIQMFKHGLAEKKKAPVTYCPSCKTVLSDEQTEMCEGVTVCERCKTPIERKELKQWFFKITKYADRLLSNLNHLSSNAYGKGKEVSKTDQENGINWSEKTKRAQRNWIGKSEGINITYEVEGTKEKIVCFTTTPVNFGATFIVVAPEHGFVSWLVSQKSLTEIKSYVDRAKAKSEQDRIAEGREKTGVFTGFYAINHVNGKKIPIWISDFVLASVGTGAVQGCPGHDKRDFIFAKKFGIPIQRVVTGPNGEKGPIEKEEDVVEKGSKGVMINSDFLNGIEFSKAMEMTKDYFEKKGWGKRVVTYKLRDWCISRQRYWGPPIPMINCAKCGWQPVPEKDLPVLLPYVKDYKPTGDGKSPLAKDKKWMKVRCPNCGEWAERETDVSDTFLDSAWYFLRYPSVSPTVIASLAEGGAWQSQSSKKIASSVASRPPRNDKNDIPWDPEITRKWLPVDMYIGGNEHAVLHLMYSRFVTMALKDMGFIDFEEPFKRFFAHGLLIKEGAKMSKSRGNVVNPNMYLDKYGADCLRLYILFLGPYDSGGDFKDTGIAGIYRFLNRIWTLVVNHQDLVITDEKNAKDLLRMTHKTIKKVGEDISNLRFNTAIASLMEYYNALVKVGSFSDRPKALLKTRPSSVWQEAIKTLLLLLAPFAPFIMEELWQEIKELKNQRINELTNKKGLNSSVHNQPWPQFNPKFLETDEVIVIVQVNGKLRDKIQMPSAMSQVKGEVEKLALQSARVRSYVSNKANPAERTKNIIFVPGRLINFVV